MRNLFFLFLIVLMISCGKKTAVVYEQIVRSPLPEKDIPFTHFQFDADSAVSITMETGSMIKFDASSFETRGGKPVKGKISFKVREFHNAEQLFRAGIPMSTDTSRNNFLQSAGMIEVRAYMQDEELKLKPGKEGAIELAGFRPSDGYRLYQLGDDVNWRVTDTFRSSANSRKMNRLKELEKQLSTQPDSTVSNGFEIAADLSEVPSLKPFKNITWEMVGGKRKNDLDLSTASRMHWDSVRVVTVNKNQSLFRIDFIILNYKNGEIDGKKVWSVNARPRLNGRSINDILKEQEKVQQMLAEEKKRVAQQADMVNSFKINQMGIWNIDKIMKLGDTIKADVSFDFGSSLDKDIQKVMVYMLLDDDNSVISFMLNDMKQISIPKSRKLRFVAMLPGGKAVIADNEQVQTAINTGSREIKLKTRGVNEKDFI